MNWYDWCMLATVPLLAGASIIGFCVGEPRRACIAGLFALVNLLIFWPAK